MRSYSMQAAWLLAWGWAGARFAARGSLWAGAAAMAGIGAGALMTGYLAIVAAPFLSLAILARARPRRRALALWAGVAGAFVVFFLFWGDAFFSQAGLRRPGAEPAPPFAARLGAEAGRTIAAYWSTLFSWGLTGQVDPFSTPLAYYPLFFFYAAALGFALHGLIEAPSSGRIFLALAAAGPGAAAALANALRPDSLPIQARYFYAFAPWFYLWLCEGAAHGWAKCAEWTGRTRRYSRQR
ncbi:MAG: hypothetical protein BWZ10_02815 [candidate division BRC1 bacterium ADurb.BinA364]|nr:MAG: hypothetical protein BWZ10_02815 [candidate division BRC1 bacterium ADurb.BinA364]